LAISDAARPVRVDRRFAALDTDRRNRWPVRLRLVVHEVEFTAAQSFAI